MPDDRPHSLNRPLWGKPRPEPVRETDPARIELAVLRRERDTKDTMEFLTAMLAGKLLVFLAAGVPVLLTLSPTLTSTLADLWTAAVVLFSIVGPFTAAAVVFLLGVPRGVRLLTDRGLIPVYQRVQTPPWRRRTVVRIWTIVIIAAALGPWGLAVLVAEAPREIVAWWATFFGGLLVYSSPMLLAVGTARMGESVFCRRCGYPREAPAPRCCPECGNPWLDRWCSRMGQRRYRRDLISLAIGLLLVGLTLVIASSLLRV